MLTEGNRTRQSEARTLGPPGVNRSDGGPQLTAFRRYLLLRRDDATRVFITMSPRADVAVSVLLCIMTRPTLRT
jgi:hypothetical protein